MTAAYTQLIPFSELAPGQAAAIRNEVIKRMVEEATAKLHLVPEKLVVRDIRVKDDLVVYSKGSDADVEDWANVTATSADAYETMATGTMGDQRWMGIYGVKTSQDNACTAIKFNIGGGDRAIWQLQSLSAENDYVGLTPSGIVIPQNAIYTISRYVRQTLSQTFIALKGVVVEPRGKVLSP